LKPRQRDALWLAYAEGSSHEEIARALGVRVGSIKLILFRARRKLARLLRGDRGMKRTECPREIELLEIITLREMARSVPR
jgi:RNA polymerase sigma-70 factor (ECF subfamily)